MDTIGKKIEPDEQPESDQSASTEAPGAVLGSLAHDDAQSGGISTPAAKDLSTAKKQSASNSATGNAEPLALPRGAIVSMRKSGGLKFRSRTVTVHRDGQITHSGTSMTRDLGKGAPSRLTNDELSALKLTVSKANLDAPTARKIGAASQQPDAFAYEIVARTGTKQTAVEVFDGSVPDSIKPLIRALSRLMARS